MGLWRYQQDKLSLTEQVDNKYEKERMTERKTVFRIFVLKSIYFWRQEYL